MIRLVPREMEVPLRPLAVWIDETLVPYLRARPYSVSPFTTLWMIGAFAFGVILLGAAFLGAGLGVIFLGVGLAVFLGGV